MLNQSEPNSKLRPLIKAMGQSLADASDYETLLAYIQGVTVSVSAAEFKRWLDSASLSASPTALSAATGLNRGTLRNQLLRGSISETTVVAVARAYNLGVVRALSFFSPYTDLESRPLEPTTEEVTSQVHVADLMAELQFRVSQKHYPRKLRGDIPLIAFPHEGSVRAWIDVIDGGDIRRAMSQETNVAATYIANQLSENKLNPSLALAASRAGGVSLASGFVITGVISPAEGGWQPRAREDALLEASDEDLVDVIAARIRLLQRRLKQHKEALEYAEKMTKILG